MMLQCLEKCHFTKKIIVDLLHFPIEKVRVKPRNIALRRVSVRIPPISPNIKAMTLFYPVPIKMFYGFEI